MEPVIEIAQALTRFRSTHERPEEMKACLEYCRNYFADLPVHAKLLEYGSVPTLVVGNVATTHYDVLLVGHIDTVEGTDELFAGTLKNGRLYGRGTLDMKAFVATSMVVFSDLVRADFSGTIGLVIVTDEELGGRCGARHLVEDLGYTADTVLVPDDGEAIDRVIGDTKHILQLSFVAKGKEAHACRPWNGQNAITALFTTYQKLAIALDKLAAEDAKEASDPNWITTYNIGTINGGVATNEVPEQAEMTVDVRFVAPTTRAQLMQLVEESLAPGVKMNVALEGPPTTLMRDAVVDAYLQSIAECTGKVPQLVGALGGTDGRYFAYAGMRTIVHQSAGGNAQAADEYVETQGLLDLVQIQKQFIETTYGG